MKLHFYFHSKFHNKHSDLFLQMHIKNLGSNTNKCSLNLKQQEQQELRDETIKN